MTGRGDRRRHGRVSQRRPSGQLGGRGPRQQRECREAPLRQDRKGNRWLRGALTEAALAAGPRTAKGALAARYRRVMRHRGHKKAVVAVALAILVTAYHMLARQTTYQEPGTDYDDRRHAERARHHAIQALERQGYRVMLEPAA